MDQLESLFGRVTFSSLSGDLVIIIAISLGLCVYIYQKGVKDIFILSLALYVSQVLSTLFPWTVPNIGSFPGDAVLFLVMTAVINQILRISPLGASISISKKSIGKNLLFGVSVAGLLLVNLLSVIKTQDQTMLNTIEKSLFSREIFQLFWTIFPLLLMPLLKPGVKKSSKTKK